MTDSDSRRPAVPSATICVFVFFETIIFKSFKSFAPSVFAKSSLILTSSGSLMFVTLQINLALNYGSKAELVNAMNLIFKKKMGKMG